MQRLLDPVERDDRLSVAGEAARWILGAILDVADDQALSFSVEDLLGPPDYPVRDAAEYPRVRRRAKLLAARVLVYLAGQPEQLVARGADLLESVIENDGGPRLTRR